jgi:predicted DNA-binding transcriptional regulator YafY
VRIQYRSWNGDLSERAADLYALVYNEGYWYAVGYCHLRQDMRTFRLDRIMDVVLLAERFEEVEDFDALDFVLKAIALAPNRYQVELVLDSSLESAQSAFGSLDGAFEQTPEGIIFRRNIAELDWLAYCVLRAPFPVRVRQPPELRAMLGEMGASALRISGG